MKTTWLIVWILLGTLLGIAPLGALEAATHPRVVLLSFANQTGNQAYDAACDAALNTLTWTLKSLDRYDVVPLTGDEPDRTDAALGVFSDAGSVDTVLYGTLTLEDKSLVKATLRVFDRGSNTTVFTLSTPPVRLLEIFSATDDLVSQVLGTMTGTHIGFGALAFRNTGEKGTYRVEIDGIAVGANLKSLDRWKDGDHQVRILQNRMLGPAVIFDQKVTLVEGEITTVKFTIPLLTDQEKTTLDSLEADLKASWSLPEAQDSTQDLVDRYLSLVSDVSYSLKLTEYQARAKALATDWEAQKKQFLAAAEQKARQEAQARADVQAKVEAERQQAALAREKELTLKLVKLEEENTAQIQGLQDRLWGLVGEIQQRNQSDRQLRSFLDGAGWISTLGGLAGTATAGVFYFQAVQAMKDYRSAVAASSIRNAKNRVINDEVGFWSGVAIAGVGAVLAPLLFMTGPSSQAITSSEQEMATFRAPPSSH